MKCIVKILLNENLWHISVVNKNYAKSYVSPVGALILNRAKLKKNKSFFFLQKMTMSKKPKI